MKFLLDVSPNPPLEKVEPKLLEKGAQNLLSTFRKR